MYNISNCQTIVNPLRKLFQNIFLLFIIDISHINVYTIICCECISGCGSVWLERHLREVEAASSNLVTPIYQTTEIPQNSWFCGIFASSSLFPLLQH